MCDKKHYDDLCSEMAELRETVTEGMSTFDKFLVKYSEEQKDHKELMKAVGDMVETYRDGRGFFRVIKWFAVLAGTCATLYGSYQAILHWRPS